MPEPIEMGPELEVELTSDSDTPPAPPAPETPPSPETPPTPPETKETPVDPAKPVDPVAPKAEETLYHLPDGRKVNAETLAKEFKENFLPEFTRKSQAIAEYEKAKALQDGKDIKNPPDPNTPKWKNPDYVPENYAEVIEIATAEAEKRIQGREEAERNRVKGIQDVVEASLGEIKKNDPNLDESALFQHANKYGFTDLTKAHANMRDIKKAREEAEQNAIKNIRTRDTDPIAGGDSGATSPDDGIDMGVVSGFSNAVEFLGRVKGSK